MSALKKYWYLPLLVGLLGLSVFLYTHPQQAGPAPMTRKQAKRTAADVVREQQQMARDQRAAAWSSAEGRAYYANGRTAATHATTVRLKTHPHAPTPARPELVSAAALRAADSLLANY